MYININKYICDLQWFTNVSVSYKPKCSPKAVCVYSLHALGVHFLHECNGSEDKDKQTHVASFHTQSSGG